MGDFNAHIGDLSEFTDEHYDIQDDFKCLQHARLTCCKSVNCAGKLLLDIAAAGPYMLTTGRGKGDSGQATFVGYHGRHRSRPDHILMTPNFYHNLLSTDIQPSNEQIADHCSITACFKVRQSGLTGADMNLEPQHVCHGGCLEHNCIPATCCCDDVCSVQALSGIENFRKFQQTSCITHNVL
jgi:hypothetical protein